jgi:hypothetical protein
MAVIVSRSRGVAALGWLALTAPAVIVVIW